MEKKTIELDGKTYEIRLVEPGTAEPTLPTLMEVFNKVKPIWFFTACENIVTTFEENDKNCFDQLSTEAQCKRSQTLIAMQNIADYYNGEVDYRGVGWYIIYPMSIVYCTGGTPLPKFKSEEHAWKAFNILRNENLLDNLK